MMRRTTRSQTRAALVSQDTEPKDPLNKLSHDEPAAQDTEPKDPLNKLSHDELGVVFDLLGQSSLWPFLAVALTSTCKGLFIIETHRAPSASSPRDLLASPRVMQKQ